MFGIRNYRDEVAIFERAGPRGGRGGDAVDRPDAGAQGPSLLSPAAERGAPGSRCTSALTLCFALEQAATGRDGLAGERR